MFPKNALDWVIDVEKLGSTVGKSLQRVLASGLLDEVKGDKVQWSLTIFVILSNRFD